jgi:hypothetical protein
MLKSRAQSAFVIALWLLAVLIVFSSSVLMGARWSTMALLLLASAAPMAVAVLLGFGGARSLTTHELLYAVNNEKDGRS